MNVQPNFWRGVRNAIIPSLILWALIIWSVGAALAQSGGSTTRPTWFNGTTQNYISTANPLPISGNITASLGGFQPSAAGARGTPLTVTVADSSGNLPAGAAVVAVTNVGTNPMYCNVNGIAATVADQYISSSGGWFAFTIPAAITTLHCIATGGSTTANTVGGSGLPTGTGGGGGASGGTSNITQVAGTAVNAAVAAAGALPVDTLASGNLYSAITSPVPCKAAATWNASAGLTGTNPAGCDGSAALWVDQGAIGGVAVVPDPCQTATKVYTPINVVTGTNTIITGVSAKKKYICNIMLFSAGTDNVAVFQATTGTSCVTALVGVIGGTTTATGMQMTAQTGFVMGNGASAVAATTVVNTDLCIVTSASVQMSGVVVTVDQ